MTAKPEQLFWWENNTRICFDEDLKHHVSPSEDNTHDGRILPPRV